MRYWGAAAIAVVVGWYAFALAVLHPLANGPVIDSWIYNESVRWFLATGQFRFVGYTETMPVAQVVYGAAWGALFGTSAISLDLANVALGIVTALMLYALALRCGAQAWQALAASSLLICNPCFLFLSFSFMSEIAFLAALLGSLLAFANAEGPHPMRWLWISAGFGVVAFAVRPFGGIAILGAVGAILIYERKDRATMLAPFAFALVACGLIWWWLTILRPPPWKLLQRKAILASFFEVAPWEYLRMGIIGPLLYLGIVLSPLALLRVMKTIRFALALAVGIFAITLILVRIGSSLPATPEMSCFGGWSNALILHGLSNRFEWHDRWQYAMALLGSIGAAGLILACVDATGRLTRASAAVLIASAIYWIAVVPLWFFNDRYFLVLVPAAALILATAPLPERMPTRIAAFAMTAVMGLMSLGGTYAYQRGLSAVIATRDMLEQRGIARASIDAGYALNGMELYPFPDGDDSSVPMITSSKLSEYTVASSPIAGTEIVGTFAWPGPFGFRKRELYVLRRSVPPN
ncbi:MAG TPA: hypothetical protein VKR29_00885 [Candidatus Binataceae bacterium]|nr:hypothetical protein [Candidatus Binataceae bacterium]